MKQQRFTAILHDNQTEPLSQVINYTSQNGHIPVMLLTEVNYSTPLPTTVGGGFAASQLLTGQCCNEMPV